MPQGEDENGETEDKPFYSQNVVVKGDNAWPDGNWTDGFGVNLTGTRVDCDPSKDASVHVRVKGGSVGDLVRGSAYCSGAYGAGPSEANSLGTNTWVDGLLVTGSQPVGVASCQIFAITGVQYEFNCNFNE